MQYQFDEIIDRRNTNSDNADNWRKSMFAADPARTFPWKDEDMIRMWVADMDFAVAPEILQAVQARLDQKILGYGAVTDPDYYPTVRRWCERRYGWSFPEEQLVFSPGVVPALLQLAEDLVKPDGGKVLTMMPCYGSFRRACQYNGVELVGSPLSLEDGTDRIDFDDLAQKAADPAMRMLILCNPHNPTGRVWTADELHQVAAIAERHHLWVVSDEIHCDLLRSHLRHTPMGAVMPGYDRLIVCMSASKSFNLAGLMHSHIIIRDPAERKRFCARSKTCGMVDPLSVAAHKAAYASGDAWLDALRAYLDGNLALVEQFARDNLPEAHFRIPEATYFAWLDLRAALPEVENLPLFFAEQAGVLVEAGDAFFVASAEGFVRLNLAIPRAVLQTALARMAKAIEAEKAR